MRSDDLQSQQRQIQAQAQNEPDADAKKTLETQARALDSQIATAAQMERIEADRRQADERARENRDRKAQDERKEREGHSRPHKAEEAAQRPQERESEPSWFADAQREAAANAKHGADRFDAADHDRALAAALEKSGGLRMRNADPWAAHNEQQAILEHGRGASTGAHAPHDDGPEKGRVAGANGGTPRPSPTSAPEAPPHVQAALRQMENGVKKTLERGGPARSFLER